MRKTIKYKGTDLVYSQTGGGQTLVLLHGFLEDRSMWNDYAERWSKTHTVICIDLLGHGETGNLGYVHHMHDQADAILAVLEAENVKSCSVIGHSMGGYVALALAEKRSEFVSHLVLFHSTAFPDSEAKQKDRERVIDLVQRNKSVFIKAVIPSLFAEVSRIVLKTEVDRLHKVANGFSTQGIIANIRGMKDRPDRSELLKNGAFKKLIVHGEFDSVIPTDDILKQAGSSTNIQLEIIPSIGHMGHLEAPDLCFNTLDQFLTN